MCRDYCTTRLSAGLDNRNSVAKRLLNCILRRHDTGPVTTQRRPSFMDITEEKRSGSFD